MKRYLLFTLLLLLAGVIAIKSVSLIPDNKITGAPPYYVEEEQPPSDIFDQYAWVKTWKRPEGSPRVGLQVGHWKNEAVPDELHRLRGNTGANGGGLDEWEVNMQIAQETGALLESRGITVDILSATVPHYYWADVFVAIHADGSEDITKSGFKAATPRRDLSKKADILLKSIETSYAESTGLTIDPNITRNMKGYYAFSYWRYEHAVHPMTTSLILETGFLTNPQDRRIIVNQSELSARGLADGILNFLKSENLIAE